MSEDAKKQMLDDAELEMVSGGGSELPESSYEVPEKCPVNIKGKHTFVMEPNSLFTETCIYCGCKRRVEYPRSDPLKPTRT